VPRIESKSQYDEAAQHDCRGVFTSVGQRDIADGRPAGAKDRRGLVIAGDDAGAKATVARLLDECGFDAVDAGPLREGWRIQRDTPGYGPRRTADQLRTDLASAKRYAAHQGT
jgi:predicted dinucleotide-binding enzyme